MIIPRYYSDDLKLFVKPNKVLVIYGSRQTGKNTLVNKYQVVRLRFTTREEMLSI